MLDDRRHCGGCGRKVRRNEYGNRDYTGFVELGGRTHSSMCDLLGYFVSVSRGKYIFNGLARFLAVLRPVLGLDRQNVECFFAYIWTSRRAAGALHYLCEYHLHIMRLGQRGHGPLGYIGRQAAAAPEDPDDEGM